MLKICTPLILAAHSKLATYSINIVLRLNFVSMARYVLRDCTFRSQAVDLLFYRQAEHATLAY